ncbi:hypothetical protein CC1G_10157 [Coprinopsis cinerea okayama7|uniref:Uncharacterized protein n=1 Tax=Coprinopsis cinerea (strain Okayama-7 / 130 / ATCC MYA-4618 / FGSC 9003) TaxID=240176 RepID=A8PEF4_COPC7|nr:hypothetical protein CC1G_10157 [Coprinopsis cinerea okayama7\|eukprot:XP_001840783.2 hypothetical protein CC1G_10157 [Coprinopsis cinerea okayama7\
MSSESIPLSQALRKAESKNEPINLPSTLGAFIQDSLAELDLKRRAHKLAYAQLNPNSEYYYPPHDLLLLERGIMHCIETASWGRLANNLDGLEGRHQAALSVGRGELELKRRVYPGYVPVYREEVPRILGDGSAVWVAPCFDE